MRTFFVSLILLFGLLSFGVAQPISAQSSAVISGVLKTGDVQQLSNLMDNSVDLVVNQTDDTFDKNKAIAIIQGFFRNNKPQNFTVKHEVNNNGSKVIIGTLQTSNGNYRTTIGIKNSKIQELCFEK